MSVDRVVVIVIGIGTGIGIGIVGVCFIIWRLLGGARCVSCR